jgi:branched-chain amino acid transport system substrate-binding protein
MRNRARGIGLRWAMAGVLMFAAAPLLADSLKIGLVAPLTGPGAESGRFQIQGAKLAVEEVNKAGGVLGRQVELLIEDDQTTNPGAVLAFSKLAGDKDIPAFIGSIRSTQVHAMAPDILKVGKPVMIGGTDPQLTRIGNPWLFRFRPNDIYSARVIADFGVNTLKLRKWAIVHSTDAFGTSGMKNLSEELKKRDVTPVLVQGYSNNSQDFTPVALAVKQSGADVMGTYMTFEPDQGIFAKQLRQLGVGVGWVGSPTTVTSTALTLAGPAWSYDAVNVLALAINRAKSLDPQAIRTAILAIKGYKGAEGTYNFDPNGDGLHGYNIVKNEDGKIVFNKHIDFND